MTDPLTLLRENDLPPKWDGAVVVWDRWEPAPIMFICSRPPRKHSSPCPSCGLIRPIALAAGTADRGIRLLAIRCTECAHDQVVDHNSGEVWDLGPEDYGDNGSNPPTARPPHPRRTP